MKKNAVELRHHDATGPSELDGWCITFARVPAAGELVDIFDVRFRVDFVIWRDDGPPILALEPVGAHCSHTMWTAKVEAARAEWQALEDKLEVF